MTYTVTDSKRLVRYRWCSPLFLASRYLEPEDLLSVSSLCYTWWKMVFQGRKGTAQALLHCEALHFGETENLYRKLPLRFFSRLKRINLKRTFISSKDFLKLVALTKDLEMLNIEGCVKISEVAIFKAKQSLRSLPSINISFNEQLSVLAVACLCCCPSLRHIRARGLKLEGKELLFLAKTFPQLQNGQIT